MAEQDIESKLKLAEDLLKRTQERNVRRDPNTLDYGVRSLHILTTSTIQAQIRSALALVEFLQTDNPVALLNSDFAKVVHGEPLDEVGIRDSYNMLFAERIAFIAEMGARR